MKNLQSYRYVIRCGVFCFFWLLSNQSNGQKNDQQRKIESVPRRLSTSNDSLQYALGAFLGQWVNGNGFLIDNPQMFINGMDDVFRNQPRLLNDSLVKSIVSAYQLQNQIERGKKAEDMLFSGIKEKKDVGFVPGGVYYLILKEGEGAHPVKKDSVILHYVGLTADGKQFENTYLKNQPVTTAINDLIPGIANVLPLMGAGSKWKLFIPASQAYGTKATPSIPANSALVVELELLSVKSSK